MLWALLRKNWIPNNPNMKKAGYTLMQIGVKYNSRLALWGMLLMTTLGEGNNALQMKLVNSPYFMVPLIFLALLWVGAALWWNAPKPTSNEP